jgi:hypothetical protein
MAETSRQVRKRARGRPKLTTPSVPLQFRVPAEVYAEIVELAASRALKPAHVARSVLVQALARGVRP